MSHRIVPFLFVPLLWAGLLAACGGGAGAGGPPPQPPPIVPPPASGPLDISNLVASPGPARGSAFLQFTAPAGTGGGAVDSYVVKASVPQILSAADLPKAFVVPQSYAPKAPGALESMTLSGLEPGQTIEFSVQAVRGGVVGPFSYAPSTRVTEGAAPGPPPGTTYLSGPTTITQAGYYVLTQDVTAAGTAFEIQAKNVTLDLGGRRVTFGTGPGRCHGVHAQFLGTTGATVVQNGTIVQGNGGGSQCCGVFLNEMHDVRVSRLDVTAKGPDAEAIAVWYADGFLRVDHCRAALTTTVVADRHAGIAALDLGSSGRAEVDHNEVTASPQWGIRLTGTSSTGTSLIHHNRILGTKALVANGYMIGVHMPDVDVFENECAGESRGIHVDFRASPPPGCRVHDNVFRVQDQRNPEYPDFHWVHGIKIETASRARVERNLVIGTADDAHAEVRALDVDQDAGGGASATGIEIRNNRFLAVAKTATWQAVAFHWISGTPVPANDIVLRHNVFSATDQCVRHDGEGLWRGIARDNVYLRDLSLGAGHPFYVEQFSNTSSCFGTRWIDPLTTESLGGVDEDVGAGPYDSTREWTLTVVVVDGTGLAVAGATVTARDSTGALVFSKTTDAGGWASGTVVEKVIGNGPLLSDRTPHDLTVLKAGVGTYAGPVTVRARTALRVNLVGATATPDVTPPSSPTDVTSHVLAATRALFRWAPSTDESRIAAYLVFLDGEPFGVTDATEFSFFGLDPLSPHVPSVQAIDAAGLRSSVVQGPAFTTWPEDRGP